MCILLNKPHVSSQTSSWTHSIVCNDDILPRGALAASVSLCRPGYIKNSLEEQRLRGTAIWGSNFDEVTATALFGGHLDSGQTLVESHSWLVRASHSQRAEYGEIANSRSATACRIKWTHYRIFGKSRRRRVQTFTRSASLTSFFHYVVSIDFHGAPTSQKPAFCQLSRKLLESRERLRTLGKQR